MAVNFSYGALLISNSAETIDSASKISEKLEINFPHATDLMSGLEYLMDFQTDIIFVDLTIGIDEALEFLRHISDDYENMSTPIVLLAGAQEFSSQLEQFYDYNVISIVNCMNWSKPAIKLLNYLRINKLNLFTIQDSLIKSEDKGAIDALTGAYNRYGCEDIFHSLSSREKAYDEPFSLIMADIDHFKSINDTYGHDVGDEVLKSFSKTIKKSIRRDDALVRLGGEEFVIFLSNADCTIAKKSAEKIRLLIQDTSHSSVQIKITCSFGVVEYKYEEDMDQLIKRADELLYEAKRTGRNKVLSQKCVKETPSS